MKNLQLASLLLSGVILMGCGTPGHERKVLILNGDWDLAQTDTPSSIPVDFDHKVPVPGLIDMASPEIGLDQDGQFEDRLFWYRKTFIMDEANRQVVQLKINKAKYFTRVYLNRNFVGESPYCFVPLYFDLKPFLNGNGEENELIISVGCWNNLPDSVTNGWDFEKLRYIPGIYDDVKIMLANKPLIANVQAVPLIEAGALRIHSSVEPEHADQPVKVSYIIRESVSRKEIATGASTAGQPDKDGNLLFDFSVPMPGCTLWTPENPFLYELELATGGDTRISSFGMRIFSFDKDKGMAMLNGEPYFMRGTNVCIFRFFEDPDRGGLPWDREWVARLHKRFKEMHWNSIRYCIGFPPESWYEIADSIGFLIQDEYPIWTLGESHKMGGVTPERLSLEYASWMRERWNHPCEVIWDAQNESVTDITGQALQLVRHNDLSNRPWDNGWAAPQAETDCIESHPYRFGQYRSGKKPSEAGPLKDLFSMVSSPDNGPNEHFPAPGGARYENAIIINEYAWIWLNRNGTPTTLTDQVYENVFPEADSPARRYVAYAKHLGMLTEYWRAHRQCAGVLHFCGLGYSRPEEPRGQTSDNFTDIQNLTFEPQFYKYVRPAFYPVGLMIDMWEKSIEPARPLIFPLHIINDFPDEWNDEVLVYIRNEKEIISKKSVSCHLLPYGKEIKEITIDMPINTGAYQIIAEIHDHSDTIRSIRDIKIEQSHQ
jgi:beta-galactosidase